MRAYRRDFDKTNYLPFLIKSKEFLEKYNEIWERVRNTIKKDLIVSETVYNEKYKTKTKSYEGKISTNILVDRIPRKGS